MITNREKRHYTIEEYLDLEEKAEYKSEYHHGEILAMAGGTTNHNRIIINFCSYLNFALREQNAEVFAGDVRLWLPRYTIYTYPDIMIIEGNPVYEGKGTTTVTNPLLIAKVLFKATNNYDKTEKFRYYRSVSEFKEYILIDQYSLYIEQFTKTTEGKWLLTEHEKEDDILTLSSIDFQISLQNIYQKVDFAVNNPSPLGEGY